MGRRTMLYEFMYYDSFFHDRYDLPSLIFSDTWLGSKGAEVVVGLLSMYIWVPVV